MDNRQSTANFNSNYNSSNQNNYKQNQNYQNQQQYQPQLKNINFDISDVYFPLFVLQLRFDVFPLRNRALRQNYSGNTGNDFQQNTGMTHLFEAIEDEDELYKEHQRQYFESTNKMFFILRDHFLLTKIHITGTVVFQIRKDDRFLFGVDDSSGVMTCVLWLNDFSNQPQQNRRQNDFRAWLTEKNVGIGSVLSVLGGLEFYKDKLQVNVHKLRMITDSCEEMLCYQQTIQAQKCYFDPFKPFQRRLFGNQQQQQQNEAEANNQSPNKEDVNMQQQQQQQQQQEAAEKNDVYKFSVKRIKKKINDFILNNYNDLFFTSAIKIQGVDTSEESPQKQDMNNISDQNFTLTRDDFLTNKKLLQKIEEELKFCDDPNKDPVDLLKDCLLELEEKGFLNLIGAETNKLLVAIRDQRHKLKHFISSQLKSTRNGQSFECIYKQVCSQYDNFYTKEFVFKVIDELFQMGLIYEISKCSYAYIDSNY